MESSSDAAQPTGNRKEQRDQPAESMSASVKGPVRILVVDNHPETLLLMRHFLSGIGTIEDASSVDQALEKTRSQRFDLILIDENLGEERTGIDLLRTLRDEPGYVVVPMIACTAYALPGDRNRLLGSGFTDYLSKPFTRQQVIEVVRRHIRSSP